MSFFDLKPSDVVVLVAAVINAAALIIVAYITRANTRGSDSREEISNENGELASRRSALVRLKKGRLFTVLILFSVVSTGSVFFMANLFFNEKNELMLFGSGTAYSFIESECDFLFSSNKFQLTRLDAPTGMAIEIMAYTDTREDSEAKKKVKLPSIIGMAASEINDTQFNTPEQDENNNKVKFYAINIATDTLRVSLGGMSNELNAQLGALEMHNRVLPLKIIEKMINKFDVVYIPREKSGTYNTWFKQFQKDTAKWPVKSKIRAIENTHYARNIMSTTAGSWIALSSKYYNLSNKVERVNVEAEVMDEQGRVLIRPIYLFGSIPADPIKQHDDYVYVLKDKAVCEFWRSLLDNLEKKDGFAHRVESIRRNFLLDIGGGQLAIKDQPQQKKVMIFEER